MAKSSENAPHRVNDATRSGYVPQGAVQCRCAHRSAEYVVLGSPAFLSRTPGVSPARIDSRMAALLRTSPLALKYTRSSAQKRSCIAISSTLARNSFNSRRDLVGRGGSRRERENDGSQDPPHAPDRITTCAGR